LRQREPDLDDRFGGCGGGEKERGNKGCLRENAAERCHGALPPACDARKRANPFADLIFPTARAKGSPSSCPARPPPLYCRPRERGDPSPRRRAFVAKRRACGSVGPRFRGDDKRRKREDEKMTGEKSDLCYTVTAEVAAPARVAFGYLADGSKVG